MGVSGNARNIKAVSRPQVTVHQGPEVMAKDGDRTEIPIIVRTFKNNRGRNLQTLPGILRSENVNAVACDKLALSTSITPAKETLQ